MSFNKLQNKTHPNNFYISTSSLRSHTRWNKRFHYKKCNIVNCLNAVNANFDHAELIIILIRVLHLRKDISYFEMLIQHSPKLIISCVSFSFFLVSSCQNDIAIVYKKIFCFCKMWCIINDDVIKRNLFGPCYGMMVDITTTVHYLINCRSIS